MPSADELRANFSYDPLTGEFRWLRGALSGEIAGSVQHGYRTLSFGGVRMKAHRAAWLLVTGAMPVGVIDHINGDPGDNRISNLRDVSLVANRMNQHRVRCDSKTGFMGVTRDGRRYAAVIEVNGKRRYLGHFDTPEEAHKVALARKRELHPYFAG